MPPNEGAADPRQIDRPHLLLDAALAYAAGGYFVFPARVTRNEDGKKVPRFIHTWREASTVDGGRIRKWWGPGGQWEGAHICIDCGKSGLVVLDADGDDAWERLRGLLADADWHTRAALSHTPRPGGRHLWFREHPRRVVGNNQAGVLGEGIDVRGLGGLVFAPPSVDELGEYRWDGVPPGAWAGAPSILALPVVPDVVIDALAAARRSEPGAPPAALTGAPGPQHEGHPSVPDAWDTPGRLFTKGEAIDFCKPFMRDLKEATDGTINDRLNKAAKALSHFGPQFWPVADAHSWLMNALKSTDYDGRTWKAEDTIRSAYSSANNDWHAELREEEFGGSVAAEEAAKEDGAVNALLAEMLDSEGLDSLADLEPLIDGFLYLDTVTRVNGESGAGKSFVLLDMAAHVGAGQEWHGHEVTKGPVVYLVAEGARGIRKRKHAWERFHGRRMEGVWFLPRPVQVASPEWATLTEACRRLGAVLVIADTQARVTEGVEENSNTEMGAVIGRLDALRRATGACVALVHHTGHQGEHGRGASAVRGALQTELHVTRTRGKGGAPGWVDVGQGKQKDHEELVPARLNMHVVDLGLDPRGRPVSSLALDVDPFDGPGETDQERTRRERHEAFLAAVADAPAARATLMEIFERVFTSTDGATRADVIGTAVRDFGMARSTANAAWSAMIDSDRDELLIKKIPGRERYMPSYRFEDETGAVQ